MKMSNFEADRDGTDVSSQAGTKNLREVAY